MGSKVYRRVQKEGERIKKILLGKNASNQLVKIYLLDLREGHGWIHWQVSTKTITMILVPCIYTAIIVFSNLDCLSLIIEPLQLGVSQPTGYYKLISCLFTLHSNHTYRDSPMEFQPEAHIQNSCAAHVEPRTLDRELPPMPLPDIKTLVFAMLHASTTIEDSS